MDMLSGLQIEADIINLTILECKSTKAETQKVNHNNNKSNHIGM